ncbi:MAG: hypothetical protein U1E73_09515 [Planctomycetota bacterium]
MSDLRMEWLAILGYRTAFRNNGWVECLLWREHERWLGSGADETEAFANALQAALPSEAARRAFDMALAAVMHDPERLTPPELVTPEESAPSPEAVAPVDFEPETTRRSAH